MQNSFSRASRQPSNIAALTWIALAWLAMSGLANAQTLTSVMYFDGITPQGGLTKDANGNFYGSAGGSSYAVGGLLYELANANNTYSISTIYQYGRSGVWTGANPSAALLLRSDNFLYGVTTLNSIDTLRNISVGGGTIFKVSTDGQTYSKLFDFDTLPTIADSRGFLVNTTGAFPRAQLTEGIESGVSYLYGTTFQGGANGTGTVFKIRADGTGFLVLADFGEILLKDGTDSSGNPVKVADTNSDGRLKNANGVNPDQRLVVGGDGYLYGVTTSGGTYGTGIIYRISVAGGAIEVLHEFSDIVPGISTTDPTTNVVTTTPNTNADGAYPLGGLLMASNGLLYGTASGLGANGAGNVFSISTAGAFTPTYNFNTAGSPSGSSPSGNLIIASNGMLAGTTQFGGVLASGVAGAAAGTVYTLSLDGATYNQECVFNSSDVDLRANPNSGVVQIADGSYVGISGGAYGNGIVFQCGSVPSGPTLGIRPAINTGALSWWIVAALALLLSIQVSRRMHPRN